MTSPTTEQVRALLAAHPVFSLLEARDIEELATDATVSAFAMGQDIVAQGESGDCAWLLVSGSARVLYRQPDGQRVTLARLGPGALFGEQALLTDEPRNATVRASEDVQAVSIDYARFGPLLDAVPGLRAACERVLTDTSLQNFLRTSSLLGKAGAGEIRALVAALESREAIAGTRIDLTRPENAGLHIVQSGRFTALDEAGNPLRVIAEGDVFGRGTLVREDGGDGLVAAKTAGRLLFLSRQAWQGLDAGLRETLSGRFNEQQAVAHAAPVMAKTSTADTPAENPVPSPPRRRSLRRYPFVPQLDESDCGAACMAMIGRYYGARLGINRLREVLRVGREGASLYHMARGAEQLGYRSRAIKVDYERLQSLQLPAIAFWKGYHYIVVYAVTSKRVVVGDPAGGVERIPRKTFEEHWSGHLLELTPGEELVSDEPVQGRWSRFLPLIRPHRVMLFEVFIASLLLNLFALAMPIFTQTVVDKVLIERNVNLLNIMLAGMVLIGVFQVLTTLLRHRLLLHVSTNLRLAMSAQLFSRILRLGMRYFDNRRIGDILTRFGDNEKIQQLLTGAVITTLLDGLMIFIYVALMLFYSPELTGVAFIFIPLLVLIAVLFTPILKRHNERYFERTAVEQSRLIEAIRGIGAVKAGAAEIPVRWRYEEAMNDAMNSYFRGARAGVTMQTLSRLVQIASATLLLWYGARLVLAGEMSVGQLMAFQALVALVMAPILGFIGLWQQFQDALLSLQRLSDIYESELEQAEGGSRVALDIHGNIRFDNLCFHYNEGDKDILRNITLDIPAGEKLAVVGRSGSGKSTLVMLLQGFYAPTEGRILVDGNDLRNLDFYHYRKQLGIVPQESAIFNGTIRENIAMHRPDIELEQVARASTLANAHEFIMGFPLGYDTVIGEMGIKLSGGQRQRICIARALLHDPRILILDEATSAMDAESEQAIQQNLEKILADRTALIIAHRFNTIRGCDRILVLDEGLVAELGTHEELMALRGLYFYLYSQQMNL